MAATVNDILEALESVAPVRLAEEWDNVGLQLGSRRWSVKQVMTALDATPDVLQEVRDRKGDVLVTHHPLIFRPLGSLDFDTPLGRMLQAFCAHQIAVISAHTNLDAVGGGVNDVLASIFAMDELTVLQPSLHDATCGLGRVGRLSSPTTLGELAAAVKVRMGLPNVRIAGDLQLTVRRVALCSGSGSGLMAAFLASDAEVFVTGDVRYHEAREIEHCGRGVIDIGHF